MGVDPIMRNLAGESMVRVLIVDDHEIVREGLKSILSTEPWVEVVGIAANGREALYLYQQLQPDVVVMDLRMPVLDGLMATRLIKSAQPHSIVIIMNVDENPSDLFKAIEAGATGYLLKDVTRPELLDAMQQALHGHTRLSAKMLPHLIQRVKSDTQCPIDSLSGLTPKELQVLRLMGSGKHNKEIAEEIGITVATVKAHLTHIYGKLGVSDRTQAVIRAMSLGLVRTGVA